MRYIDRPAITRPPFFDSPECVRAKGDQEEFYRRDIKSRRQKRSPFESQKTGSIAIESELRELFADKCAYCERQASVKRKVKLAKALFRPCSDAMNLDGTTDPDHYWWLAYEWSNQYLVCSSCDKYKINRFPVSGTRSKPREVEPDRALLLDPCEDHPELYLRFHEDGRVTGVRQTHDASQEFDRGEMTIELLSLNRNELLKSRQLAIRGMRAAWEKFSKATYNDAPLRALLGPQQAHLGMVRQLMAKRVLDAEIAPNATMTFIQKCHELKKLLLDELRTLAAEQHDLESISPETQPTHKSSAREASKQTRVVYVDSVEINNFKGIQKLRLNFFEGDSDPAPSLESSEGASSPARWKMLLGENGTGKSTVLQAVALVLAWPSLKQKSDAERKALGLTGDKLLRDGAKSGSIKLTLSDATTLRLSLNAKHIKQASDPDLLPFLRGYGATRLTHENVGPTDLGSPPRVVADNLFSPLARLVDVETWLLQLDGTHFDIAAKAIKELVQSPQEEDLTRDTTHVRVGTHRLDRLSDGYRSLVAVACDLMAGVPHPLSDLRNAAGIALIDELDSHLHPRWKMRVVGRLCKTFPSMQFITSTHDPLCLRGLVGGQVAVFQRNGDLVQMRDTDLPSPAGLRIDQLLTSPHFGMDSTIDPGLDDLFAEYYQLLAKRPRTTAEELRCGVLKQRLDEHRHMLGYTRRDQLVYEIIDECLATEQTLQSPDKRRELRDDTKQRIRSIWDYGVNSDGGRT
ncbi:MAG: AAA family ATPase [Planctomycetota bacterium]|nr:AAA family ATPase [Planctomycetota bacterium]